MVGLVAVFLGSKADQDALKAENETLKQELEALKFGAERLLDHAKLNIENANFTEAKADLKILLEKHPASEQAVEAGQLIVVADKGILAEQLAQEKAKAEKEKAEKDRLANATKKMRTKYDDIREVTWYRDKTSPQYTNYNGFYAYIGKAEGNRPWLNLSIQYAAADWLFIKKYTIKVDGQTYTITEDSYGEIKRDNGSGGIWEWLDRKVGYAEYEIIKAVAYGKDVKIRFSGTDYYEDKIITDQQKTALRNVLDAYEALGGSASFK
jgi:hypothetical protein